MVRTSLVMNKEIQLKRIKKIMIYATNEAGKVCVIPLMFRCLRKTDEEYVQITVCDNPKIINWTYNGHNDFRVNIWWDYPPEHISKLMKGRPENLKILLSDVERTSFRLIVGAWVSFYFDYLYKIR